MRKRMRKRSTRRGMEIMKWMEKRRRRRRKKIKHKK